MLTTIREEQLLAKFAGEDVAVPQPCTRTEKFLAKMAGLDVQTPTPITREEQILNKIAQGGGGGVGVLNVRVDSETSTGDRVYLDATWQEVHDALMANKLVAFVVGDNPDRSGAFIITHEAGEAGGTNYVDATVEIPQKYPYINFVSNTNSQWLATLEMDDGNPPQQMRADSATSKLYIEMSPGQ